MWAIDVGGHVVFKMNPQGRVIMRLGRRGVTDMGHNNFNLLRMSPSRRMSTSNIG